MITNWYGIREQEGRVFITRISEEEVCGADRMFTEYADKKPRFLKKAFAAADHVWDIALRPTYCVVSTTLKVLPLSTFFSVNPEGTVMVPEFTKNVNFLDRTMEWQPPDNCKLKLAFVAKEKSGHFYAEQQVLFAINQEPGFWKLPLPNHYGDGKLCLGETICRVLEPTVQELTEKFFAIFKSSRWNNDQMPRMDNAKALFRFNTASGETLLVAGGYGFHNYCQRVNNVVMSEVCP